MNCMYKFLFLPPIYNCMTEKTTLFAFLRKEHSINRRSYLSAHVLLNLLNEFTTVYWVHKHIQVLLNF